jgi:hypothetical protein
MSNRYEVRLSQRDRIGGGAYGHIFAPAPGDRAIKVFRRITDPALADVAPYVFAAETAALRIAAADPVLASHCPAYFGEVSIPGVTDHVGSDVSTDYWLDLAYVMQRLPPDPEERKFGSFYTAEEWHLMEPLERAFEAAGIRHLGDASVLHWRSGRPIVIDFGMTDAAGDHARIGEV